MFSPDQWAAALPADRDEGLRAALERMRRAYERGATINDLVLLIDATLASDGETAPESLRRTP
jgi:hypothetical protein